MHCRLFCVHIKLTTVLAPISLCYGLKEEDESLASLFIILQEESSVENEFSYKVLSLESQTQRERLQTRSGMRPSVRTPDSLSSYQEEEESGTFKKH